MANCVHLLANLKSVCDLLLRFWEARNMKSGGNQIGVDLLLLDAKVIPVRNSWSSKLFQKDWVYLFGRWFGLFVDFSFFFVSVFVGDSHLSHRPVHDCTSISGECFFIYRSNDSSKHQLRKRGGLNIWDYTLRQCLFTQVTSTVVSTTGSTNVSDYDLIIS